MILSFKGKLSEAISRGEAAKGFPASLVRRAELGLRMVEAATIPDDLRSPPGNRLHAHAGDRTGQYARHQRPMSG